MVLEVSSMNGVWVVVRVFSLGMVIVKLDSIFSSRFLILMLVLLVLLISSMVGLVCWIVVSSGCCSRNFLLNILVLVVF